MDEFDHQAKAVLAEMAIEDRDKQIAALREALLKAHEVIDGAPLYHVGAPSTDRWRKKVAEFKALSLAATEPEASCVREPYPPVCMTSTPAGNPGGGCTWPDCSCMPRGQYAEMILEHAEEVVRQAHSTKGKADDVS